VPTLGRSTLDVSLVRALPVNARRLTAGWFTSALSGSTPPVRTLTTPAGKTSAKISTRARARAVRGVCEAALMTTTLPMISAGSGRVTQNIRGWLRQ